MLNLDKTNINIKNKNNINTNQKKTKINLTTQNNKDYLEPTFINNKQIFKINKKKKTKIIMYNKNTINFKKIKLQQLHILKKKINKQEIFVTHRILQKLTAYRIFIIKYFCTFNNTHISIHTPEDRLISSTSVGAEGYKRLQKSTKFATFKTSIVMIKKLKKFRVKYVKIYVKGLGYFKKTVYRILQRNFKIVYTLDVNKYAHNGCKLRKKARK
jgi:ribosomal protein S11